MRFVSSPTALVFATLLSCAGVNAQSTRPTTMPEVEPHPMRFGHDRDLPLALQVVGAADFVFADWDGDGDQDLLCGGGGAIRLVENVGTRQKPRFENTFKRTPTILKDERLGRFFSIIRNTGVNSLKSDTTAFVGYTRHEKVTDAGKNPLFLHVFTPRREGGKLNWTVTQALGKDGQPIAGMSDTWMCPTIDCADINGDGRDDLVVSASHPMRAQPSGQLGAGYNNPDTSWRPNEPRLYVMMNASEGGKLIFDEPQELKIGDKPVAPFAMAYPIFRDVDSDGLIDLVVGQAKPGLIFLKNVGTKSNPRFTDAGLLIGGDGKPVLSIYAIHPRFADLDGDGRDEMLTATYFGCVNNLRWYQQPKVAVDGWMQQGLLTMVGGRDTPVTPQGIGTIEPIDWDNDGDIDLCIGSEPCSPMIVINEGTNAKPIWSIPKQLQSTDGRPIEYYSIDRGRGSVWGPTEWYMERSQPRLVDWDGDGVRDMLTGSMGARELFLKGHIVEGELRFDEPNVFTVGGKPLAAGHRVQPAAADFDGDGQLDLVAMDEQNVVNVWPGDRSLALKAPRPFLDHEGKPLQLKTRILDIGHGRCTIEAVDWDLDGRLDLMIYLGFDRKRGGIYYYHASKTPMQFDAPVKFRSYISFHEPGIGLADFDGDGLLDIFTGGDGEHLGADAEPRGQLFVLYGRDLPVKPARRDIKPITPTVE